MKNILLKSFILIAFSIGIIQTSSAYWGRYNRHYCEPHYYGHRYYAPARGYFIPGHWAVDGWGYRVWVGPCYR